MRRAVGLVNWILFSRYNGWQLWVAVLINGKAMQPRAWQTNSDRSQHHWESSNGINHPLFGWSLTSVFQPGFWLPLWCSKDSVIVKLCSLRKNYVLQSRVNLTTLPMTVWPPQHFIPGVVRTRGLVLGHMSRWIIESRHPPSLHTEWNKWHI